MSKRKTQRKFVFACLAPAVILVILFMVIPIFNVFRYSLYGKAEIVGDAPFVGLNDFKILLIDLRFAESMQSTILIIVMVTLFTATLAVLFMTLLTREEFEGKSFFHVIFYISNILSTVTIVGIFSAIYVPGNGLLNNFLGMIGFGMLQKQWMGDPGIILYSIISALVWQTIGCYMIMYMASMFSVPENLYEAVTLGGAGRVKQSFMITLSLIWNNIRTTLAFFAIPTINLSFMFIQTNTNGNLGSEALLDYVYNKAFEGNYPYGMAIDVITFAFPFALFDLLNKIAECDILEFQEV